PRATPSGATHRTGLRTSTGFAPGGRPCPYSWRRPSVPAPCSFSYAIVRVVPHVEREEFINAGVVVFCDALDYLAARIALDEERLRALAPTVDLPLVRPHL